MSGGKTWGWPISKESRRKTPADYERDAVLRDRTRREIGAVGALSTDESPHATAELLSEESRHTDTTLDSSDQE